MPKGTPEDKNTTKRPLGERMQNPMAEKPMRVVNLIDEAVKDGCHVYSKMGMAPKKG